MLLAVLLAAAGAAGLRAAKPGKEGLVGMAPHLFCTLPGHKGG